MRAIPFVSVLVLVVAESSTRPEQAVSKAFDQRKVTPETCEQTRGLSEQTIATIAMKEGIGPVLNLSPKEVDRILPIEMVLAYSFARRLEEVCGSTIFLMHKEIPVWSVLPARIPLPQVREAWIVWYAVQTQKGLETLTNPCFTLITYPEDRKSDIIAGLVPVLREAAFANLVSFPTRSEKAMRETLIRSAKTVFDYCKKNYGDLVPKKFSIW